MRGQTHTTLGVLVVLASAVCPAAAQVTFGSPADPPRVALGGGAFDVVPNSSADKPGVGPAGLALGEYRFGDVLWIVAPFVGAFGTGKGAFYGYGGVGFDINFCENVVATPTAAVGYGPDRVLHPRARGGLFGPQDGHASINFRVLYQLIKA